ncbi:hypothetical protein V3G39_01475 [Dermatophilaceae bacterium Sec6.4]
MTDRDHPAGRAPADISIGFDAHHNPARILMNHGKDRETGQIEQGIGPSTPAQARATRTVIRVEVFSSSGSLVAPDPEGLDPHPRTGTPNTSTTLRSEELICLS